MRSRAYGSERVPLVHAGGGGGLLLRRARLARGTRGVCARVSAGCARPTTRRAPALPAALVAALVAEHPQTLFVLDEAYCDLLPEPQWERESLAASAISSSCTR